MVWCFEWLLCLSTVSLFGCIELRSVLLCLGLVYCCVYFLWCCRLVLCLIVVLHMFCVWFGLIVPLCYVGLSGFACCYLLFC